VEHHMDLVRATATKVVALKAGEVLMSGTPSGVLDSSEFKVAIMGALPASVSDSCHDLIGRS
jgi:ABC-type branched-subunit amino acid transport system ATPase component